MKSANLKLICVGYILRYTKHADTFKAIRIANKFLYHQNPTYKNLYDYTKYFVGNKNFYEYIYSSYRPIIIWDLSDGFIKKLIDLNVSDVYTIENDLYKKVIHQTHIIDEKLFRLKYTSKCIEFLNIFKNHNLQNIDLKIEDLYQDEINTTRTKFESVKNNEFLQTSKMYKCKNCGHNEMILTHKQLRAGDEMTDSILTCLNCKKSYKL